EWFM
ncbi:hypothetical protein, partial [Klebsiella phage vB_KpnM_TU02]